MDKPLVSAIIAVRNGERFLASAIKSILKQDYRPIEIIVVDGQSEDRTVQIAKSFTKVLCIRQVNKGVADAYNIGINAAKGEFVAFLSHDDLWTPDKLIVQVTYLIEHPNIQYTIAKVKFFLEADQHNPPGFREELLENEHVGRVMETLVVRKSLFDVISNFRIDLTTAEDVDWFARANDQGVSMAVIHKVLLHKRVHDKNISLNATENNHNLLKALRDSVHRKHK